MSISTARRAGRGHGGKRRLLRAAGVVACAVLTLAVAAPAWASLSATGTLAPIGWGSHLLTVTNTGSETITSFAVSVGEKETDVATNIVPRPACKFGVPATNSIQCTVAITPGAMTQMCYTGPALGELMLTPSKIGVGHSGTWGLIDGSGGSSSFSFTISPSPAVALCPLRGFTAGSGKSGKGAHPWSHALCKSTYKAWTKKQRHATRSQKKAEANALHKTHGCPLSILK